MNSPLNLFIKRVQLNLKFQYKVIRTIVDFVVVMYFFVPAIIAVVLYSHHLWTDQPNILFQTPLVVVLFLIFIVIASSTCRSFYEYGDQLFLIQQHKWYHAIKRYGIYYTLLVHTIKCLVLFSLVLPLFYIGLQYSLMELLALYIFTVVMMTGYSLVKRRVSLIQKNVYKAIGSITLLAVSLLFYMGLALLAPPLLILVVSSILMLVVLNYETRPQKSYATFFVALAAYDIKDRFKFLKFILTTGEYKIPDVKQSKLKPQLFKRSNAIFIKRTDVNVLVENGIKQFIRNSNHLFKYIYFSMASCYALFLLPQEGRIVYIIAFAFIFFFIGKRIWQLFMDGDFIKLYKWDDYTKINAMQKGSLMFALPGYSLLFIVFLCFAPSLLMLAVYFTIGLIAYFILYTLSVWTLK